MRILVLNCGSSSLKFQLIETAGEQVLARGGVERIGAENATLRFENTRERVPPETRPVSDHRSAVAAAFAFLQREHSLDEIQGVGHRVVHGGDRFSESVLIDGDVLKEIEAVSPMAPLHNPPNLKGYYASREFLPRASQVAVFDTAFHQTLPPRAFLYGIPYDFYSRDRIRRYGFHGTSHRFVSGRYAEICGDASLPIVTCHLGNGCSVCAVQNGRSIDTSMGFTPMEGLLMGTRAGDIDAGVVLHLIERGLDAGAVLNHQCGLLGLSGVSPDMRDVLKAASEGNQRAVLAIDVFCYRVAKYVGAYHAALGGARAVVFAGGIGENSPEIRARVCGGLAAIGLNLDSARNQAVRGSEGRISPDGSPVEAWVIPTNEELLIARDTARLIAYRKK